MGAYLADRGRAVPARPCTSAQGRSATDKTARGERGLSTAGEVQLRAALQVRLLTMIRLCTTYLSACRGRSRDTAPKKPVRRSLIQAFSLLFRAGDQWRLQQELHDLLLGLQKHFSYLGSRFVPQGLQNRLNPVVVLKRLACSFTSFIDCLTKSLVGERECTRFN